jgi:aldose 1-epimerase
LSASIRIAFEGWTAEIAPAIGGAIRSLVRDGQPILRRRAEPAQVRAMGCYPLLPYANRIAGARFRWRGAEHRLAANDPGGPHSLHGVGWRRPWRVEAADAQGCTLTLDHRPAPGEAADWPFAFRARQRLSLGPDGLTVGLSMVNVGEIDAPAGIGLHPYFPRRPGEQLAFRAEGAWRNGPDLLPASRVSGGCWDYAAGRRLEAEPLDNDFFGWDGAVRLSADAGPRLVMRASPAFGVLRLFAPAGADFFAVEPVSHRANAINHPGAAMSVLAPGETLEGEVLFAVEAR